VFLLPVEEAVLVAPAIVELGIVLGWPFAHESFIRDHLPNIPHLQQLILRITRQIHPITLTTDIGHALRMPYKNASWSIVISQSPSVPDFDHGVVTPGEDYVGVLAVGEAD